VLRFDSLVPSLPIRRRLVVASLLLGGCASSAADEVAHWKVVQRERLARLYQQEIQGQEPQEPARHVDELEPGSRVGRARRFTPAVADRDRQVGLTAGIGSIRLHAADAGIDEHAAALTFGFEARPPADDQLRPGFRLRGLTTHGDLFAGQTISDGTGPVAADAYAFELDAFPHLVAYPVRTPGFDLPLRFGPFVDWLRVDHSFAATTSSWTSFGARVEVEPTWRLAGDRDWNLALFGRAGLDAAGVRFFDGSSQGGQTDRTSRWQGELGAGLRLFGHDLAGELGYHFRRVEYGGTSTDRLGTVDRFDVLTQSLELMMAVRF